MNRLIEAEHGNFTPCYCGSDTYLGDHGRGHESVCCSRTMQPIEGCKDPRQYYVAGFAFSGDTLVGIRKQRPDWQAGKISVPGGHIEEGETAINAMCREFYEETGITSSPDDWQRFACLEGDNWTCTFFTSDKLPIFEARTMTDEEVFCDSIDQFAPPASLNNIAWLIQMAKSIDTDRAKYFEIIEKY